MIKRSQIVFILLFSISQVLTEDIGAANYTTTTDGNWSAASSWVSNNKPGAWWGSGDTVFIQHNIVLNQNIGFSGALIIESTGTLKGGSNIQLNNGGYVESDGEIEARNFSLNSTSTADLKAKLTVTDDLTINSNSSFTISDTLDISDDLQINSNASFTVASGVPTYVGDDVQANSGSNVTFGGTLDADKITLNGATTTFNGTVNATGDIEINNKGTTNINANLNTDDDLILNGGTTNIDKDANVETGDDLRINGATLNNDGEIDVTDDLVVNSGNLNNNLGSSIEVGDDLTVNGSGTITNNGQVDVTDDTTLNGDFVNNSRLNTNGDVTINGGGTLSGSGGIVRTNSNETFTNYGSITGALDFCNFDGTNTTIAGGGSVSGTTTYCQLSAPLPIHLIQLYALIEDELLMVNWEVATSADPAEYVAEYSYDGANYSAIDGDVERIKIKEKENERFTLSTPIFFDETIFVRLKMLYADGNQEYSAIRAVSPGSNEDGEFSDPLSISVRVTPLVDGILLERQSESEQDAIYEIVMMNGMRLTSGVFEKEQQEKDIALPVGSVYIIRIIEGEKEEHFKVRIF